jgi:outer membrane protein assembly factor BamB
MGFLRGQNTVKRLTAVSVACLLACAVRAENWPQWRGPNLDGVSKETNLPAEWGPDKNVVWKLKMPGMGSSTPAVWGEKIFLTSQDGDALVLLRVSTDGKEVWRHKLGQGNSRFRRDEGNLASASPSTDGSHVWVFVGSGELACLDFDGNEVWKFNLQKRYGPFKIQFGLHSTPVLFRDRLYLQLIHSGGAQVIALDTVVAAGPTFQVLARNQLPDQFTASPALSNGRIYLRGFDTLWAIALPGKENRRGR